MSTDTAAQPESLFIGLGNMGRPMLTNYTKTFPAWGYDINPKMAAAAAEESGAKVLEDLNELPSGVRVVILMLPNSRIVEGILDGEDSLLKKLEPGTLVIDMSSSKPSSTRKLAQKAEECGILYADAPVSGGTVRAQSGELAIMLGGSPEAAAAAQQHLAPMAGSIIETGPSGSGHAAKALNNLLSATNLTAAAEILCVAEVNGISPETMINVINSSTSRSQASEYKYPNHILTGTFDSGFAMDLMLKDMMIAVDLVDEHSVQAPLVRHANEIARAAREALGSERPDHTELARYVEESNHTALRNDR